MAQVDSRIPLGVQPIQYENRLAQLAQMEQLEGMRASGQLRGLQMQQLQREMGDNALMRRIVQDNPGVELGTLGQKAISQGLVTQGLDLQKRAGDAKAADLNVRKGEGEISAQQRTARKGELEDSLNKFQVASQLMAGVRDQPSYDAARQEAARLLGPEAAARMSPTYNPAEIAANRQKALTVQQQIEAQLKDRDFGLREKQFTETRRHNSATEVNAAATLAQGKPGQFFVLADGRTVLGDPRSGQVRPAQFAGDLPAPTMPPGGQMPPGMPPGGPVQGPGPGALPPMPGTMPPMPGAPLGGPAGAPGMQPGGSPPAQIPQPQGAGPMPGQAVPITPGGPVMQKPAVMARDLPTDVQKGLRENAGRMSQIDSALAEVAKRPGAFGLQNMIPGAEIVQQYNDPEGVRARAAVADIGSKQINDRSGAAVTISEYPRLAPFVPKASDKPEVVREKLLKLREGIAEEQRLFASAYGTDQGYRATPLIQGGAGATAPGGLNTADPLGLLGGGR